MKCVMQIAGVHSLCVYYIFEHKKLQTVFESMALNSTHNNCINFDELMSELSSQEKTYYQELITTNVNSTVISNFAFLASENSILAELGFLAEDNLENDPVTSIEKIGQFGEFLARQIAQKNRVDLRNIEKQHELVQKLKDDNLIDSKVYAHLDFIRLKRNDAVHYRKGNYQIALVCIQYAYEIGFWYDCKFGQKQHNIKHSFIIPSNLNKILSSQYEEAVAQLGAMITDYESLNNQLLNSPNLITDLQKEKQSIYVQITKLKNISQQRQNQKIYRNNLQKQKLLERKRKLELKQIKVEIDISDLQGFESNSEISAMIINLLKEKAVIESELTILEQDISIYNSPTDNIEQYTLSEKITLGKLLDDYNDIKIEIKNISQPEYFDNKIKQKQKEIVSILSSIELMMQKASKSNISLPPIPFFILHNLDKYNLYQF